MPIKIKGHSITGHVACFISYQESTNGKDPNINIVSGIHNIKGKTSVNILVSNYNNKHVTFNKGEYLGHLENIAEEENPPPHKNHAHTTSSITTKKIISEQEEPNAFEPLCHKLKPNIEATLEALLKEYESQFMRDETTIGTTPLTKMSIDTANLEPASQKPYPIAMKCYQWVKDEIEMFTYSQSDLRKLIMLVSTHHSSTKRRWRKMSSN